MSAASANPSQNEVAPLVAAAGARLDRYELLCPLAQGGMAAVWAARLRGKHGFEKIVAVKMIRSEYAADSRFQQMFLDEAHIAAGIEHDNVAQILDLGEHQGVLYLVMELVDGEALSRLMRVAEAKESHIPIPIACRIIADICAGLHAAHELRDRSGAVLGVVHRDVSPQNILVTTRGVPKLIDFGVAKARDRMAEDTNVGTLKGKVSYMAPEQIFGKDLDRRADVWAIGAVLHHVLAGSPPFEAGSTPATLRKVISGEPPAPLPDRVPPAIAAVVARALQREPDARYPSAAALRGDLELAMRATGQNATTDEVAAYCSEQLAERDSARRASLVEALREATERAKGRLPSSPRAGFSLEESIARMSPSERTALAVKLAEGGLGSDPLAAESAARLLTALGATLRPSSGSESGANALRPSEISSNFGAALGTGAHPAASRSRGGVAAVALVAVIAVAALFGARHYLSEPALPAAANTVAATPVTVAAPEPPATSIPAPPAAPSASVVASATAAPSVEGTATPADAAATARDKRAMGKKKSAGTNAKGEGAPEHVDDGF